MKDFLVEFYEDHGCCAFLVVIILALALVFGLMCANAALLMVCWNFAVIAAVSVCAPIGFWQAFVLGLAVAFLFGGGFLKMLGSSKNND